MSRPPKDSSKPSQAAWKAQIELLLSSHLRKFYVSKEGVNRILDTGTKGQLKWLEETLSEELYHRQDVSKARLVKQAGFPIPKDIRDYDFTHVRFPKLLPREDLLSLRFIPEKKTLVFFGACGTGKTMLATCLGIDACMQGYKVKFTTVSQMVLRLVEAKQEDRLERYLNDLKKLDCLILDEWGYVPIDLEGSRMLFQVIADSYEHKSLIITTNLPFKDWGQVVTDEQLAAAIIDRVVHYGHLIDTGTKDWRLEHSLMKDQVTEVRRTN
ncbi:DNA replication protein [Sphaerochaeta pleomorpha str. Grapes]|uniref:DNA replication protein n=1 Tax=Sphaerochaeta pleomorpha (strain ATCC BAA-1885 / DSM 22778 / Grapes) TaxID=158190 RepID=G8QTH3_SPHPG|nr:IS21-like element helper ATPase IstB [Sphaerochaeta pleomorpha]AEV30214.1 DNA replication protein [Sphaerochaeta pleomorpha str. Grapes]